MPFFIASSTKLYTTAIIRRLVDRVPVGEVDRLVIAYDARLVVPGTD